MTRNNLNKILAIIASFAMTFVLVPQAFAASITNASDTLSNQNATQTSNHTVKFKTPTGITTTGAGSVTINFTASFSGTPVVGDITMSHGASTGLETGDTVAASASSGTWGFGYASNTLTLTVPTNTGSGYSIAAGNYIVVTVGNTKLTNPAVGTYIISVGGTGSMQDSGSIAVTTISNDVVTVGTTVDPYLNFTLTTNAVTLTKSGGGNPSFSSTGYNQGAANTLAASTNGASGYTISYLGDTLKSGSNSIAALASPTASSTGASQFGINLKSNSTPSTGADPSGGSGAASANYNTANSYMFVTNTTTPLASAAAPSATTTFTVSYIANVTATTPAGAYSTSVTYICTGNF